MSQQTTLTQPPSAPSAPTGLVSWAQQLVVSIRASWATLTQRIDTMLQYGALGDRGTAEGTGRIYVVPGGSAYADVGSSWQEIGGGGGLTNLDGGAPDSVYGGTTAIDGGGPS